MSYRIGDTYEIHNLRDKWRYVLATDGQWNVFMNDKLCSHRHSNKSILEWVARSKSFGENISFTSANFILRSIRQIWRQK